jgi:hypothetical protein
MKKNIITAILIAIILGTVFYLYLSISSVDIFSSSNQFPVVSPVTTVQSEIATKTTSTNIANWKTYISTQYGFEFQYPKEFDINVSGFDGAITITDSTKTDGGYKDYPGSDTSWIFVVQTNKSLDDYEKYMVDPAIGINEKEVQQTTIAGKKAYEGVSVGVYHTYEVFFIYDGYLIRLSFYTGDQNTLTESKKALSTGQQTILSTFKLTN